VAASAINTNARWPQMRPPPGGRRSGCSAPPGRKSRSGRNSRRWSTRRNTERNPSTASPRAPRAALEPRYHEAPPFADDDQEPEPDPSRYDEALYGQLDHGAQEPQYDQAYAEEDDAYGYQDGYGDGDGTEERVPKRSGGIMTIAIVLALAVVGTGAAFAYRTFVGASRGGEPPIIRADAGPTKIVPSPADATSKLPDRMVAGDGTEKIVPREEAPVDVNARSGPRVVFPPLNPNPNPPPASSVASNALPPASGAMARWLAMSRGKSEPFR